MANIRQLDKRRKSVKNIRKITRTMELIATARFKKAMDRAAAATDYTKRITQIVQDLAKSGTDVSHPLLVARSEIKSIDMLVLTAASKKHLKSLARKLAGSTSSRIAPAEGRNS